MSNPLPFRVWLREIADLAEGTVQDIVSEAGGEKLKDLYELRASPKEALEMLRYGE